MSAEDTQPSGIEQGQYREIIDRFTRLGLAHTAILACLNSPGTQQAYDAFIHNYCGDLSRDDDLAGHHDIIQGNFSRREYTAHTQLGNLIVVRHTPEPRSVEDYYVAVASLFTGETTRFYVITETQEVETRGGNRVLVQKRILSKNPDELPISEASYGSIPTGDPVTDLLNGKIFEHTEHTWYKAHPRIFRSGNGGYFNDGGLVDDDVLMGDIPSLNTKLEAAQKILKQFGYDEGLCSMADIVEPVTIEA